MSLIERQPGNPSALPRSIKPLHGEFKLRAYNQSEIHVGVSAENDGTLRSQLIGHDGTIQRRVLVEDTGGTDPGHLAVSNFGWNGAALTRTLLETSGEQKNVLHGKDEASNIDAQRTDPNRIPWRRPYPGYVQVDPVSMAATDSILWNPGSTAAELYEVSFLVVNTNLPSPGAVTVRIGVDIAAGGALAVPEYWVLDEIVPYPGTLGWRGPFIIAGDDDVRGFCSTGASLASIHFRIRRVDVGA